MVKPKVKRPPLPCLTEPSVLICKEKHGDIHFHIPDETTLFAVALDILTKRYKSGDWYYLPDAPGAPELSQEQVDKLPDGPTKRFALTALANHKREDQEYRYAVEDRTEMQTAIKTKDGRKAWIFLRNHSDGEYARIILEKYAEAYYEY